MCLPPMWLRSLLIATRFLTRVPVPDLGTVDDREVGRSALAYPLVGLGMGLVLWLLGIVLDTTLDPQLAAAILLAAWVWSTGALHLDGLADSADAWVGGIGDRERTLAIMKDPACGPIGVTALILVLLCKWAAIAALISAEQGIALVWAPLIGRAQILAAVATTPYVRPHGLGWALAAHMPRLGAWIAVGSAAVACVLGVGIGSIALIAVASITLLGWRHSVMRRLDGFTGDTLGALVEVTEVVVLIAAVALIAH